MAQQIGLGALIGNLMVAIKFMSSPLYPFPRIIFQGPRERAAPKLAAVLLRSSQGTDGQLWLQAAAEEGSKETNAEIIVKACAQENAHMLLRRAAAASLAKTLRFSEGDNNGVVFAFSHGLLGPLVRMTVSPDEEVRMTCLGGL